MTHGVYVHIPFCVRKCPYCDFQSWANRQDCMSAYKARLLNEIKARAGGESVDSIFFGGGTPSLFPTHGLIEILQMLRSCFDVCDNAEITMEANPGTVTEDSLAALFAAGVNRISFGVQSLNDQELLALGRIHSAKEALDAIHMAKSVGFSNMNADVMLAVPHQTEASLKETLQSLIKSGVQHISAYSLIIEEGTPFFEHTPSLPDEDEERALYHTARQFLAANGFSHYEISNFSLPGFSCRHNIKYWTQAPYFGFGCAAHSFLHSERIANISDLDRYISADSTEEERIKISPEMFENERLMLGFRLTEGVTCDASDARIVKLKSMGLIEGKSNKMKLTERGLDLANIVFMEFV